MHQLHPTCTPPMSTPPTCTLPYMYTRTFTPSTSTPSISTPTHTNTPKETKFRTHTNTTSVRLSPCSTPAVVHMTYTHIRTPTPPAARTPTPPLHPPVRPPRGSRRWTYEVLDPKQRSQRLASEGGVWSQGEARVRFLRPLYAFPDDPPVDVP